MGFRPPTSLGDTTFVTLDAFGRGITLEIGGEIDGCGQFRVALSVDGKERFAAYFTDKSEDGGQLRRWAGQQPPSSPPLAPP
jgi:hypothetical protein